MSRAEVSIAVAGRSEAADTKVSPIEKLPFSGTKYDMNLNALVPVLWTKDFEATIDFYQRVLGFVCANRMEVWASLIRDKVELMVSTPNDHEAFDKIQFTGSFYFRPDNVDDLWQQLKDQASVVYPIESFDYGMREFAIRDNNGYIRQFGQEI